MPGGSGEFLHKGVVPGFCMASMGFIWGSCHVIQGVIFGCLGLKRVWDLIARVWGLRATGWPMNVGGRGEFCGFQIKGSVWGFSV